MTENRSGQLGEDRDAAGSDNRTPASRIIKPFKDFYENRIAGAGLLISAAIIAAVWANSPFRDEYRHLLNVRFTIGFDDAFSVSKTIHHWINDGLMGIFFFVVGLEIKREFIAGHLAELNRAILPIAAALGGMLVPSLVFILCVGDRPGADGWAVPMATDIAFALGILALAGDRIPFSLKIFLTTLAIVDDIGAVIVIAVFYTESIGLVSLGLGGIFIALSVTANLLGVRNAIFYFILGTFVWLCFLDSGVHATIAALVMAMTIPAKSQISLREFYDKALSLLHRLPQPGDQREGRLLSVQQQNILSAIDSAVADADAPVQHLEHSLMPLVTLVVLPLFAFANSGVRVDASFAEILTNPIFIGVFFGLFLGKQVGIFLASFVVISFGLAKLPLGTNLKQLYGVSLLGGIGFTMSLFISELAFSDARLLEMAKFAVLAASALSAVFGMLVLLLLSPSVQGDTPPIGELR